MPSARFHETSAPRSDRGRIVVGTGFLVAAALLAYLPSFSVPFFFDDKDSITDNPTIRHLWNVAQVLSPPNDGGGVTGRPLVNLSLAINYAIGGTRPFGYHVLNFILHAAASLALFGVVRRTLLSPPLRERFGATASSLSFFIALLWSLHPLQTESVTCIIQRTELLAGLWYLLILYGFVRTIASRALLGWALATVSACYCGMASKEVLVSAPFVVLFYDRTFFAGTFREAWRQRGKLYAAMASSWALLVFLLVRNGGSRGTSAGFGLGVTAWSYLLKQCEAIVLYLQLGVWPHPLVIDYGNAVVTDPVRVLPQGLLLIALVVATFMLAVRRSAFAFLGVWFFAILGPSSSVVPLVSQTVAEHRMYLPLAAVIVVLVLGVHAVGGRRALPAIALVAVALGAGTFLRNRVLQDEVLLWTDCAAKVPGNARAHDNLGSAFNHLGRPAEAIPHYERALQLNPHSAPSNAMLADAYAATGDLSRAITRYERALALSPTQRHANNNLGVVFDRMGQAREAAAQFERALQVDAHDLEAQRNLGVVLVKLGEPAKAASHYEQVLRIDPNNVATLISLGDLLAATGQPEAALARYRRALELRPGDATALTNLANVFLRSGRPAEAATYYERALAIAPRMAQALSNYGVALVQLGRTEEGIAKFERALIEQPDLADARENLAQTRTALRATEPAP